MAGTPTATSSSSSSTICMDEKWKLSKTKSSSRSRSSTCSTTPFMRNSSSVKRRCAFTRKCATLVKEQRARFYIMRRCITMLVCWRDYGDS